MTVVPDGVPPARAVLAGTVETAVNALWDAAPLLGDRVAVVGAGHGRLLRRAPAEPASRRSRSRSSTSNPAGPRWPPRSASTSRCPPTPPATRDLVVHASATSAGLQRSLDLLAPEGTVHRAELVRRRRGPAVARRRVPLRPPRHPRQPGRHRLPGPRARRTPADRLALALDLLRDPVFDALDHRRVPLRRAARGHGPAGRGDPAGALPHRHLRRGVARVQRDRPRPHDDRPQLPRRGVRARAAPARRDVRRRRHVPARRPRRGRHRGRHRAGRRGAARRARRAQLPQPRRRAGLRRHEHHHRGAGPGRRRPARRAGARRRPRRRRARARRARRSPCTSRTSPGRATSGRCDGRCTSSCRTASTTRRGRAAATPTTASLPRARRDRLVGARARRARLLAAARRGRARRARRAPSGRSPTAPSCCSTGWSPRRRPTCWCRRRGRLRLVVLVHMPLGDRPRTTSRGRARNARSSRRRRGRHDQRMDPAPAARAVRAAGRPGARRRARRRRRRPRAGDRGRRARCSASRR